MVVFPKTVFAKDLNITDYTLEKVMKKLDLDFVEHPTDDRINGVSDEAQKQIKDYLGIK